MFKFLDNSGSLEKKWNERGELYARQVNEMVEFGETQGWENWKGKEPEDKRDNLAADVLKLLRIANKEGTIEAFREKFPPAHAPFIKYFEEKGQSIEDMHFISDDTIVFIVGTNYDSNRLCYMMSGNTVEPLSKEIVSIGKSPDNKTFAICKNAIITTNKGWQGQEINKFLLPAIEDLRITQLIPFNDGQKVLLVSSEGIYLLSAGGNALLHPEPDVEDEEWTSYIDMEHASLSPDNELIAVGDQSSDHRVLDGSGAQIAEIGPQSSYPHFSLFSKDGLQLIMNSCHFYNGITIGVSTKNIKGLKIEAYTKDDRYTTIDENCRVYAGVVTNNYYILGDASGYIIAFTNEGNKLWRHFLGSTITGMTISDDNETLWVGTCAGIVHKLQLNKGHRDKHTIGNGNHYEEFRMLFWKDEPKPLLW